MMIIVAINPMMPRNEKFWRSHDERAGTAEIPTSTLVMSTIFNSIRIHSMSYGIHLLTGRSQNQGQESHKKEKKAKDGTGESHGGLLGNTSISLFTFRHAEHRYNGLQVGGG